MDLRDERQIAIGCTSNGHARDVRCARAALFRGERTLPAILLGLDAVGRHTRSVLNLTDVMLPYTYCYADESSECHSSLESRVS
jgi:hypothetical protein